LTGKGVNHSRSHLTSHEPEIFAPGGSFGAIHRRCRDLWNGWNSTKEHREGADERRI
jgi:hypothetical protein